MQMPPSLDPRKETGCPLVQAAPGTAPPVPDPEEDAEWAREQRLVEARHRETGHL